MKNNNKKLKLKNIYKTNENTNIFNFNTYEHTTDIKVKDKVKWKSILQLTSIILIFAIFCILIIFAIGYAKGDIEIKGVKLHHEKGKQWH